MPEVLILLESQLAEMSGPADALARAIASVERNATIKIQKISDCLQIAADTRACPLTLNLPDRFNFPGKTVYQACGDVRGLRKLVETWGYNTGTGEAWLPIVLTAKGPLYAEVIGRTSELSYFQPLHLSDLWRQQLYQLGYRLLRQLDAFPAVYLMQFGCGNLDLYFDRLLPFPAMPALASIGVQVPDLFTCYWYCLTGRAILDLTIRKNG